MAAVGALVRYSANQAYFILQHLDQTLSKKAVTIHAPNESTPLNFQIDSIQVIILNLYKVLYMFLG